MNIYTIILSITEHSVELAPKYEIVYGYGAIIYAVVMAITAAYTAYSQSEAQKAQADQAEAVAENESNRLEFDAEREVNKAEQEKMNRQAAEKSERDSHLRRRALMESSYAKSGVMIEGTPSEFLVDQETTDELNVQRNNQVSEAKRMGFKVNADLLNSEAAWATELGDSQASAYRSSAQSTLIGGALGAVSAGAGAFAGGERAAIGTGASFNSNGTINTASSDVSGIRSFPSWTSAPVGG